ncbi:PDF receptor [Aplysia californica]|uniref:PDF receptor n=1 Tax=Aplysia californica TaxID=6500 RepID=A0ABM0JHU1_APLCA|nr:PDF receptor [Aplysia californica]XP_012935493.1 PDF receptor [Aplysia californica]XP_035824539.1 PDF receptor [Aplysia californica]XP_035824540.1 PDF receptor [Aplysia californica]
MDAVTTEVPTVWKRYAKQADCLDALQNISIKSPGPRCPADWEPHTYMCWPPSPPGVTVRLPCPPYDYLNPDEFVTRVCQENATWYVNETFDDKPYSNYYDCFLPRQGSAEENLRKWVNEKTVLILKALNAHRIPHLTLHSFDLFLLLASLLLCVILLTRRATRPTDKYKFLVLILAIISLIANHVTAMSIQAFYDSSNIIKCQIAKTIVSFTNIVFCQCLLGYVFLCMFIIMEYKIKRRYINAGFSVSIVLALALVLFEACLEILQHNSRYCGFGTLQTSYHWIITAPKFFIIACIFCIDSVAIYGIYYLGQPHLVKTGQQLALKVSTVCVLLMSVYNAVCEVMLVLLHAVAAMDHVTDSLEVYTHSYSALSASRGIVFVTLMCFLDPQSLALLPCACLHMFSHPEEAPPASPQRLVSEKKQSLYLQEEYAQQDDYEDNLQTIETGKQQRL